MSWRTNALVGILLALAIVGTACSSSGAVLETVEPQDAAATIAENPGAIVLDIRTPDEYRDGIIEGAVNIDFYAPDFADQLAALDRDATYVVYCRSGNRSGEAMRTFADLDFQEVSEIDGGIVNWYQQGLPVVAP
jgi:rhodanese-related sulfurtransferase